MAPLVWLVTGASSGFGRAVTEATIARGDTVIATLRTPSDLNDLSKTTPSSQLLVLPCDVTDTTSIRNAFTTGIAKFGRIDVVFNNAGYGILAEIESTPKDAARKMFDVNFWGSCNVSREAVKTFRELNPPGVGGRLLVMSSRCGVIGMPASGYYAARSLEGFAESLARELDPSWNINITLLEPGAFRTNAQTSNAVTFPPIGAYASNPDLPSQKVRGQFADPNRYIRGDPKKAAARIVSLAHIGNVKVPLREKESSLMIDGNGLCVENVAPPMRLVLGKVAISGIRAKMRELEREMNEFEGWSEDLELPEDE